MGKVRSFVEQNKTFVALVGGAVLGLIVGLIVGWVLWPVEWTSSTPANLHSKYQSDYAMWVASNYQQQGGVAWAEEKLGAPYWKKGQLTDLLEGLAAEQTGEAAAQLRALSVELGASESGEVSEPEAGAPEA
ncbi:MAG: hypothetical protein GX601_13095, partial [Anaerolineales bacterium]|nr:hypothetical protein [Anaerolineales bacterium]